MLSVILHGRNDQHGTNYHKRVAISLNCLAELLVDPNDEIVFVDYNTPDELPTIVEAIEDTLTAKTKSLIRILRVRPHHHAQFRDHTHLPLVEPIARNVAVRRTRPNKWILSTNSDMVFVLNEGIGSLTELVSRLKDGFYLLPRFELPEAIWECYLERSNPQGTFSFLREHAHKLHLHTIVRKEGFLQFDNPGDFQLILRKDLFQIGGFNEEMLKGWHVDANLCKRMSLYNKPGTSLEQFLKGYHCNHRSKGCLYNDDQNDWDRFVRSDGSPILAKANWGLAEEAIEERSLPSSNWNHHLEATVHALRSSPAKTYEFTADQSFYNHLTYSSSRIFPYLISCLSSLKQGSTLVYIGYNSGWVEKVESYFKKRALPITLLDDLPNVLSHVNVLIFDFGFDEEEHAQVEYLEGRKKLKKVMTQFCSVINKLKRQNSNLECIGINVHYTDFNTLFNKHLSITLNSPITGISQGTLPQRTQKRRSKSMKKRILFSLRYFVVRYLYDFSDPIRKFIIRYLHTR